ncbi:MAG: VF530 family DNA-binding protein [Arenicella sp.]|nr:VF530 family DNA-binding protein [Arenicella sp.]
MSEQDRNNPLHGVGLDAMFSEILRHYHWEILSEQLKFKCLESHPNFAAATKFLKKTKWAREKTEAFYLYRFKQLAIPSDEEQLLPPRERTFESGLDAKEPAVINEGDKQFFDDPISGPKFHDKVPHDGMPTDKTPYDKPSRTRASSKPKPRRASENNDQSAEQNADTSDDQNADSSDPWGKWKK